MPQRNVFEHFCLSDVPGTLYSSYGANSKCAGKPWPWRIQWWVKLHFPTLWGRHGGFWCRRVAQNLESQPIDLRWKLKIWCNFHKKASIRPRVCRTALIRSALESFDPGASNGGSNFISRHFGVDMVAFHVAGLPRISNLSKSIGWDSGFWVTRSHQKAPCHPKVSENKVWPTVRCARVRAFQRTSN